MSNKKAILIFSLFFILLACNQLYARVSSRSKACFSNIRVIQDAVEIYNMDVDSMMRTLDIDALIEGNYLKGKPSPPETSCEYLNVGDLDSYGFVICKYHGDVEHLVYSEYFKNFKYEQYDKLPQNATDDDIRLNRESIFEEREKLAKRLEFRENLKNLLLVIIVPLTLLYIIYISIPRKKVR